MHGPHDLLGVLEVRLGRVRAEDLYSRSFSTKSVGTAVGATQLIRIRYGARSLAMERIIPMTPVLAAM
jgi:hypothetical protein